MGKPASRKLIVEFLVSIRLACFVSQTFDNFHTPSGLITMSRQTQLKQALKAVLNPGVIGTVIGLILFVFSIELPTVPASVISLLAALNTPVPMLVIGYHLMHSDLRKVLTDKDAYVAMALRLLIIPLAVMGALLALDIDSTITVSVVIAVSAPVAAFTTMMAAKYGRDTELSAGIVSASSLFSLITMPLVVGLAQYLVS